MGRARENFTEGYRQEVCGCLAILSYGEHLESFWDWDTPSNALCSCDTSRTRLRRSHRSDTRGYQAFCSRTHGELQREYKEGLLDTEYFLTLRRKEQAPRLTTLHAWLIAYPGISPPTISFPKAASYTLSQWERITHYLDHELLTPDTNTIENAIRPFVIGRKNWLFSNTPLGAHASVSIYSMIETAKANGHEPYHYLCYLFNELPISPLRR